MITAKIKIKNSHLAKLFEFENKNRPSLWIKNFKLKINPVFGLIKCSKPNKISGFPLENFP
jgi:hypothetical protein